MVTTRIRSFTRVTQVVGDYAYLILRWMALGLGQPRMVLRIRYNVPLQLIEGSNSTSKAVHKMAHKYDETGTQATH